ncbi:unnamed protein product [Closterium sp. NIES-53]
MDASGWQFYDLVTHQFFASQDVTFDESISYYKSRPHRGSEAFSPPLFLIPNPPPVTPVATPPPRPRVLPCQVCHTSLRSRLPHSVQSLSSLGVREVQLQRDTAASSRWPHPASPPGFPSVPQFPPRSSLRLVDAEPEGVTAGGTGGPGGVDGRVADSGGAGARGTDTVAPTPRTVRFLTREQRLLRLEREEHERKERVEEESRLQHERVDQESRPQKQWTRRSALSRAVSPEPRRSRYRTDGPFHIVLRSRVLSPPVLPQPPESSLTVFHDPLSDYLRATRPVVSLFLSTLVTHPTAPPMSVLALVTTIAAEEAEMASYRSTSTYVDAIPPRGANFVSGMWLYKVKRSHGAPPVFKARYVARGFSQREGVDFFQTFAPTLKMTTLQVLLHFAAQHDNELHSLDFSTAFLQGSRHEQIWGLQRRHTCTDLGELQCYLGLQINRDRVARTIMLTHSHMVEQILMRFRFPFSKVQLTPLAVDHGLMAPPSDEPFESNGLYPELRVAKYVASVNGSEVLAPPSLGQRRQLGNCLRASASVRTTVFYWAMLDSRPAVALAHRRPAVLTGRLSAVLARLLYATLAGGRPCCAVGRPG